MAEWQPIETAPKDGTWVLVYGFINDGYQNECRITTAQWAKVLDYSDQYCWRYAHYESGHYGQIEPTHWMPLPPLPKEKE